jgi:hypothetical protein
VSSAVAGRSNSRLAAAGTVFGWQAIQDVGEEAIDQVALVGLEQPVCRPVMALMVSSADVHDGNARGAANPGDRARITPDAGGCGVEERIDTGPSQGFGLLHAGLFVVELVTDEQRGSLEEMFVIVTAAEPLHRDVAEHHAYSVQFPRPSRCRSSSHNMSNHGSSRR